MTALSIYLFGRSESLVSTKCIYIYGTGALGYFANVMTHWIRGLGARKRHLRRVARKNSVIGSVLSLGNAFQDYEYDSDEHELPPNSGATNVEETFLTLFR